MLSAADLGAPHFGHLLICFYLHHDETRRHHLSMGLPRRSLSQCSSRQCEAMTSLQLQLMTGSLQVPLLSQQCISLLMCS